MGDALTIANLQCTGHANTWYTAFIMPVLIVRLEETGKILSKSSRERKAINGMGRIGRAAFKIIPNEPELELAAVNVLVPPDNLAYLLRYDKEATDVRQKH